MHFASNNVTNNIHLEFPGPPARAVGSHAQQTILVNKESKKGDLAHRYAAYIGAVIIQNQHGNNLTL